MQLAIFAQSQVYISVVIFGAYGGMFTIWTIVKDKISPTATYCIGILMVISIISFVAFEIFKMIYSSRRSLAFRSISDPNMTYAEWDARRVAMEKRANNFVSKIAIPVWVISLIVTGATGFAAGAFLIIAFISELYNMLPPHA